MRGKITNLFFPIFCTCFLNACTVDIIPGIFGSTDLDKRLKEKDNFQFLKPEDRALSLGDEFSFIVLADTHIEGGNAFGLESIKKAVDDHDAKFVVICGDITQSGHAREIKKFIEIADSLEVPFYPVIGNHDVYFGNFSEWKGLIGSTRYRIDGGGAGSGANSGATLFILDSANAYFGSAQLDWLEKELKSARGRVFMFSHANLFVQSPLEQQQLTDTRERARLLSILNGRCDAVFTGHSHRRDVDKIGGMQYVTVEDFRSKSVYCLVTVKNGGISWEFKK